LDFIASHVAASSRIVVVAGAGISTSAGIPDFRSRSGAYGQFGRSVFSLNMHQDRDVRARFCLFVSQMKRLADKAVPTATHGLICKLHLRKQLLRVYNQNIDGLEDKEALLKSGHDLGETNVKLHGQLSVLACNLCHHEAEFDAAHLEILEGGSFPPCVSCVLREEARARDGRRPHRTGVLVPSIVLYDEPHPRANEIRKIKIRDIRNHPDMVIILGTSLHVRGVKGVVLEFAREIHSKAPRTDRLPPRVVYVNLTPPPKVLESSIDYWVQGSADQWSQH
ncbi:hypothetical protein BS47DRAFT_1282899, partial [Hydnum rufescens UP504]